MAGPIQKALSNVVSTLSAVAVAGEKLSENERQAQQKASADAKAEADYQRSIQKEAKEATLEADLVNMGANPESAHAFMTARGLGLDTKSFGMIRKKGKFIGSYSSLAERLSQDALTDSLSSRVINEKGFAERVIALGGTRRSRVAELLKATEGDKK